ncbi:hypothetical protein ASZ78_004253 [Callipepla squamata]|uniref:G-protein coupled receptors family 1 profile domain-containing protein n=1 Tax=Callipepla squamata TaxID=9009 RepID=A0A226NFG7_CALSU|nr:hypothetical protein ASZ78_004253 [Callipepla squamata]
MGLPALLCVLAVLSCPLWPPAAARSDYRYNSSSARGRTFLIPDRGEPIPVEDIESSAENDSEVALGSTNQTRSPPHEQRTVSVETARYLTSPWLTRFVPSVYTLVVVLSLPLNVTAIFVFLKKMKIEKPAVVYMLNLALADVLFLEDMVILSHEIDTSITFTIVSEGFSFLFTLS